MDVVWVKSPNFGYPRGTKGRNGHKVVAIVDHIMDGTLAGTDAWFKNPKSVASAHFGIGKDGTIHQYVDVDDAAWANGRVRNPSWSLLKPVHNPNLYTVSIEHEGRPGDIMPEAQYQATLRLHRYLIDRFKLPVNRDTIIGHYRIDSVNKSNCPGPTFPWDRLFKDLTHIDKVVELWIGDNKLVVNGVSVTLPVSVSTVNDIAMVPVRAFAESLGAYVHYDDASRKITIYVYYDDASRKITIPL